MNTSNFQAIPTYEGELESGTHCDVIGRYIFHSRIAAGGMASVYLGSLIGAADFSRVVAIKRMHPQFAGDAEFTDRFRGEAWLSSRLLHPNIVQTIDVVDWCGELLLVMEYIHGITLGALYRDARAARVRLPSAVVAGILVPVLHGLHAAHVASDDDGHPLGIVHRDFSPQNILISLEGHAKILDFGIARAKAHVPVTAVGQVAGKHGYFAPEQLTGQQVDLRTDVFAAGIVLWEGLAGEHLFHVPDLSEASVTSALLSKQVRPPSELNPAVPHTLDDIVLKALNREPSRRFTSAREMALAIESAVAVATPSAVSACLTSLSAERLERLARTVARGRRAAALISRSLVAKTVFTHIAPDNQKTVVCEPIHQRTLARSLTALRRRWRISLGIPLLLPAVWIVGRSAMRGGPMPATRPTVVATPSNSLLVTLLPAASPAPVSFARKAEFKDNTQPPAHAPNPERATEPRRAAKVTAHTRAVPSAGLHNIKAPASLGTSRSTSTLPSPSTCDPPTYTDSEGIKHFKDGCL